MLASNQPTRIKKGLDMDNNLRDSVEKIVHNINVGNLCEGDVALSDIAGEDEVGEATTALCSLFAEREIEARIDELKMFDFQYSKGSTYWTVIKGRLEELEQLQSQLKDQKGEK